MKRRDFLTFAGMAAIAAPVAGSLLSFKSGAEQFTGHTFPELGYAFNALEPYIDAKTMELHYNKHHRGYYTKFVDAIKGTGLENQPMEVIFTKASQLGEAVRNNGGGYYNHNLFWGNMAPQQKPMPETLKKEIEKNFGSVDGFKEKFGTAAKTLFGSGWAWLALGNDGKLFITSMPNQDNPLMDIAPQRGVPLLALDVWEHAYYLKYQNRRAEYADNFWNVVNWDVVDKRLKAANG